MTDLHELYRIIAQHLEAMVDDREDGDAGMQLLMAREDDLPAGALFESVWAEVQHFLADASLYRILCKRLTA